MNLGNLVTYDLDGAILSQTGEMVIEVSNRKLPNGVPYLEIPYGQMKWETHRLTAIDVTKEPHEPIFELIEIKK